MLRQQVDRWAQTWLTTKFSRLLELRARDPGPFNYPIEVFAEWRGKAFYLNVRYRAHTRKVENDFVVHGVARHRKLRARNDMTNADNGLGNINFEMTSAKSTCH